jgi:hypothetical protein
MYMQNIEVQFSGSPKKYTYVAVHPDHPVDIRPGDRVVVVNKIKDDGTASLSIATVTDLVPQVDGTELPAPIVDIIDRNNLANVVEIVKSMQKEGA